MSLLPRRGSGRSPAGRAVLGLAVALAVVAGVLAWDRSHTPPERTLVATFERTTSLYAGAPVKVLGVRVGKVTSIEVKGTAVEVRMTYDGDVKLPPGVTASIVPPSIVGDRFVQLAPAWSGGPALADGARLELARTAVPLELDETFTQLDDLATALGPKGADADGALSRLTAAGAEALEGNGRRLNRTLRSLSQALGTLAKIDTDASGVLANAARLTRTLAASDAQVRRLVLGLAEVSAQLAAQRTELTRAVKGLSRALADVERFTRKNRKHLTGSIQGLTVTAGTIEAHLDDLTDLLDLVPVGFANAMAIYAPNNWDPAHPERSVVGGRTGSLALRGNFTEDLGVQLSSTLSSVCGQVGAYSGGADSPAARQLVPFCAALQAAGNDVGVLLTAIAKGKVDGDLSGPLGGIVAAVRDALAALTPAAGGGR
ncbi:MCE family protein [Nocardioides sp. zg-536]|uniref:MCE family protein n=1 Tax=Nocardioides faecalis TaxID=2803858 RepID=A0A938Y3D7_9ACTN|nr:MlaD family protein [Nocardioides faecalis]MBM9461131.1 MCE family protein [Nocardioides faecalis]QVI58987.1 MCE family protein [Nocardioides faecalis]